MWPPSGKVRLVVGGIRSLEIQCSVSWLFLMHCPGGDTHVRLLNVAYVPELAFNRFSLHMVRPKCRVTMRAEEVHMLEGRVCFMRRESGSYMDA